ncbi:MAG TPA: hypothetical protein VFH68_05545 [Polyangia bacterium]|jgi:hypothetical protein|nr:hypothetical protein [Polyangia bacterium]
MSPLRLDLLLDAMTGDDIAPQENGSTGRNQIPGVRDDSGARQANGAIASGN